MAYASDKFLSTLTVCLFPAFVPTATLAQDVAPTGAAIASFWSVAAVVLAILLGIMIGLRLGKKPDVRTLPAAATKPPGDVGTGGQGRDHRAGPRTQRRRA